jgi:hypothetical protein
MLYLPLVDGSFWVEALFFAEGSFLAGNSAVTYFSAKDWLTAAG